MSHVRSRILLLWILFSCSTFSTSSAQEGTWAWRTVQNIFNDTASSERPKFIAYPTLAYTPETRWELGVSALYVFYARRDTANRLSELNAFTFYTLERQYGLWLDHAIYSHRSQWFYLGRLRYQRFPLLYYGIGPDTPPDPLARIDTDSFAFRERVLRRLYGNLYLGLEIDFQRLTNVTFLQEGEQPTPMPPGSRGSTNLGLGIGLVYDNRHNVLNVREGLFAETGFLRYDDAFSSDFSFTSYFLDARYFYPVNAQQVLAYQFYANAQVGQVPFNQLALMGGESLMRGYYLGRYRDKNLVATQVEYRFLPFPFSRRLGGAVFLGAGSVAPRLSEFRLPNWVLAGGAGVRFLIFPAKDIYTRFDVAFTKEGPGFYLFIGEAF